MTHAKFNLAIDKINKDLGTNVLGTEHKKTQEFIMPINLFVSKDRGGLKVVYYTLKKMIKIGCKFEK